MKQIQCAVAGPTHLAATVVEVDDVGWPAAWEVVVDLLLFPISHIDLTLTQEQLGAASSNHAAVLGTEALGRVTQVGSLVNSVAAGDLVIALTNSRNWSERRKLSASAVHKIDEPGDPLQLCQLKVAPTAAALLLDRMPRLMEGDWILLNAPLSSIGRCVLQLAHASGIRSIAIIDADARVRSRGELIQALGGGIVVEDSENLESRIATASGGQPVALALDALSGAMSDRLLRCIQPGGKLIQYGQLTGTEFTPDASLLSALDIEYEQFHCLESLTTIAGIERTSLLKNVARKLARGQLRLDVDSVFPMQEIRAALSRAGQRGRSGRVIVRTDAFAG